jgi:hypothetical protein
MRPHQGSQFPRPSEGHQEILGGHLLFERVLQPLLALVVLAEGTSTVAAGMGRQDGVVALGALRLHDGARRGSAALHGGQSLTLGRQKRLAIRCQERDLEGLDNR